MGGWGSGRRTNRKPTEANFWRFSISALKRKGVIGEQVWQSGGWQWLRNNEVASSISYEVNTYDDPAWLRVHYSNKNNGKSYDYRIYLTTTCPLYGGKRWWFLCPAQGCGRRVGVLYLAHIFACRQCCNLAYSSQNEQPHYRLLSKAQKIHQQLGGDGVIFDSNPRKPKGMHWKTYWKKVKIMSTCHHASLMEAAQRFGIEI